MIPNLCILLMLSLNVWRPKLCLRPSRLERTRRCMIVFLACGCVWLSAMPWPQQIITMVLAAVLMWFLIKAPYSEQQLLSLQQTATEWRLVLADGEWLLAELDGPVRDWSALLCLQFKEKGAAPGQRPRRWSLLLWRDQMPESDWRRLRVSLRWRHAAKSITGLK